MEDLSEAFVEREELMVSPSGDGEPTMRLAHFLQPTVTSIDKLPSKKWCSETKSFLFSWGEVTITLEDLIIQGYSVLGSPVFIASDTEELKKIEERLNQARLELTIISSRNAEQCLWMKKFINSGSDVEHEALILALWLSSGLAVTIRSPLQLVQIWAWERFIELRPKPNLIKIGETRFARWHKMMMIVDNVRKVLDSARENFDWRLYTKASVELELA
ncbi:hypothetical protein LWI28_013476 [Acer negundo]|uniref:Aminotransferase-like plant mobile domain-containing protein n=1 Tax=Acer negundo TaxID=4023 RepID=A0AAD5J5P7_ACENE|nr:hypothetical protein LWI28_013476 [Acer negundo]